MSKKFKVKGHHYLIISAAIVVLGAGAFYINLPSMVFGRGGPVDRTAPVISNVKVTSIVKDPNSTYFSWVLTVAWTTDEVATTWLCQQTTLPTKKDQNPFSSCGGVNDYVTDHSTSILLKPSTTYYYVVKSVDYAGNIAQSSVYSITTQPVPLNLAPTVSITAPPSNSIVNGYLVVAADATDDKGVTKVEFEINGSRIVTDTVAPYNFGWDPQPSPAGTKTFTAVAYDADGNWTRSAPVSVTYSTSTPSNDVTPPSVAITSPSNNATVSGTVTISANATDDFEITQVQFFRNGQQIWSNYAGPFSLQWNTLLNPNGSYVISATAKDLGGHTATSAVTVTVNNAVDSTPPVVSITAPLNNATVSGLINITADATDNIAVSQVQFLHDGIVLGTHTTAPYSTNWDTRGSSNGTHTITAIAQDPSSNQTTSAITVFVNNTSTSTATTTVI